MKRLLLLLLACNPLAQSFSRAQLELTLSPSDDAPSPQGMNNPFEANGSVNGSDNPLVFAVRGVNLNDNSSGHIYSRGTFSCPSLSAQDDGNKMASLLKGGTCSLRYEDSYQNETLMTVERYSFTLDSGTVEVFGNDYLTVDFSGSYAQEAADGSGLGHGSFQCSGTAFP